MSSFHVCAHSVLYFLSGVERSIRDTKFMRDDSSENFFNQDDFKRWAMREYLHQYNDFYFTSEIRLPRVCRINSRHSSPVFSNSCFVSDSACGRCCMSRGMGREASRAL